MITGIKKTIVNSPNGLSKQSAGWGVRSKNNHILALDWNKGMLITENSQLGLFYTEAGSTNSADGAGAGTSTTLSPIDGNHTTCMTISSGTSSTGYAILHRGLQSIFSYSGYSFKLKTNILFPILSTETEEYNAIIGAHDSSSSFLASDGLYFFYNRVNAGDFWCIVAAKDAVRTTTITTSPIVANTWYNLSIEVNDTWTLALFYVNDSLIGSISTNLMAGGDDFAWVSRGIFKTAGTTNRSIIINRSQLEIVYNTPQ